MKEFIEQDTQTTVRHKKKNDFTHRRKNANQNHF